MSQMERMAYLDRRLRERGWVTAEEAARHFEVSPRQVKRDIEYLRWRLDAPIVYDGGRHRYRYDKPFSKLQFTDERRVLFAALVKGWASSEAYRTLVTPDLLESLGAAVPRDYRGVADRIRYEAPSVEAVDLEVFAGLCRGIRDAKAVELDYQNLAGEAGLRRVEAQRLINYAGVWYLIAWDLGRQALRTFHLGRVRSLTVTSEPAVQGTHPGWDAKVEAWTSTGSGIFRGGLAFPATIRMRGQAWRLAAGQKWHPDQSDTPAQDEEGPCLDRTLPVVDTRELLGRVLSLGSEAEALAPAPFRQQWVDEVAALAHRAGVSRPESR